MNLQGKALLTISALSLLLSCNKINESASLKETVVQSFDSLASGNPVSARLVCGIPADSFNLDTVTIKRNGFLSDIILKYGVTLPELDKVLSNSRSVFDVRKVLPGKNLIFFNDKNSGKARFMIYESDPVTSYVFSFRDSLNVKPFRKEITTEVKYASGTISSSLWEAMTTGGIHPSLASQLSEIFAWTVDFFGLQKGDSFKVIYEEQFVGDMSLGTGKILSAIFKTSGSTFTAIPFVQNGKESYFDLNGQSLKKAFLKAPLKFSRISSRFTSSRLHPILKIRRPHYGVDYAAPIGTPVHAVGDGRIVSVTNGGGEGRMVKIKHNSTYSTAYMHLSAFGPGITAGAAVKQDQVIGFVGSSGLSTGPHLDFRFYQNGAPVDPLKISAPPAEPISVENMEKFDKVKEVGLSLMDTF